MKTAIVILALAITLPGLQGRTLKTTRHRAKATPVEVAASDTVAVGDSAVTFRGYDKPLRSRKETVLATNRDTMAICGVEFRISYLDTSGNCLHRATQWVHADIPAGETRLLTFPSWDSNCSYYYYLTRPPRTPSVTPYKVTIRPLRVLVAK